MRPVNKSFLYIDDLKNKHLLKTLKFNDTNVGRCHLCFFHDYLEKDTLSCYPPDIVDECGDDNAVYYFKLIKSKRYAPPNK